MLKTIKLKKDVYDRLEDFREKRESFSDAVARLLEICRSLPRSSKRHFAKSLARRGR